MKVKRKPRNPWACDPLMKKGGAHQKTFKAERKGYKQKLRKELLSFWRGQFKLIFW